MNRVLRVIIIVAAVVALGLFIQRWAVETPNRTVEIVYDLPGLLELSENSGKPVEYFLADLKSAGVETIAVQPDSLGDYFLQGKKVPQEVLQHLPEELTELNQFLTLPVAFNGEHFELVRGSGLKVAPKLNTAPWQVEPIWLDYQPELLIVSGQGSMDQNQLGNWPSIIALVEFATPQVEGEATKMVRLHGISAREMRVLSDERILNRYMRAVKERNLRVLYVRPFIDGDGSWERSLQLLASLEERLENAGFVVGTAVPFRAWQPAALWTALVGAGIWAAAALYAGSIFPRFAKFWVWGVLAAFLASTALLVKSPLAAKQGLALLAAIVFPALAIQAMRGSTPLKRYLSVTAVSLLGALFVVAALTGTEFLIKLQEFRGVKLMHVAPVALVLYVVLRPLRAWLKRDIPVRYLLVAGFLGLAGIVYILRTGNFGLPVANLEVQAREFLENVLRVRPRTKEFLLGHPALYFAVHSTEPHKSWWLPLAVVGQLSLVNTFTHTHTFLGVSLLRTFYGLLFGYLAGWAALRLWKWGKGWLNRDHGSRLLRVR